MNMNYGYSLALLFTSLVLSGCATLPRDPVPLDQIDQAEVVGMPGVRAWAGQVSPLFQQDMMESVKGDLSRLDELELDENGIPVYSALALSGGVIRCGSLKQSRWMEDNTGRISRPRSLPGHGRGESCHNGDP